MQNIEDAEKRKFIEYQPKFETGGYFSNIEKYVKTNFKSNIERFINGDFKPDTVQKKKKLKQTVVYVSPRPGPVLMPERSESP